MNSDSYLVYDTTPKPKHYEWIPKEDITARELALCVTILVSVMSDRRGVYDYEKAINDLPESARRHFEEIDA